MFIIETTHGPADVDVIGLDTAGSPAHPDVVLRIALRGTPPHPAGYEDRRLRRSILRACRAAGYHGRIGDGQYRALDRCALVDAWRVAR